MLRPTGWAFAILLFLLVVVAGAAQEISAPEPAAGTIIGTVLDTNGGVIPGATITLQDVSGSAVQHVTAQDNGSFQISGVKPGVPFRISVAAQGFSGWTSSEVVLQPGQFFILTGVQLRIATVQVTVSAVTAEQLATQQVHDEEKQRVVGVIPNFYVEYDHNAPPLSPKLKFQLASRALVDPVTLAGFALGATFYQSARYPGYREGFEGYGQRLGSTFAGGYTNVLVGNAILPSLLHQDPRYFYQERARRDRVCCTPSPAHLSPEVTTDARRSTSPILEAIWPRAPLRMRTIPRTSAAASWWSGAPSSEPRGA